ncbi:MAG: c-type cytochrome [Rhodospirillales bacterium]
MKALISALTAAPVLALALTLAFSPAPAAAADGEKVFKKCKACHTLNGKNRQGPTLQGAFGRACGQAEGFKYGKGYKAACEADGFVLDEAFLMEYLANPSKALTARNGGKKARSKMAFKLRKEDQRKAVIEFLKGQ